MRLSYCYPITRTYCAEYYKDQPSDYAKPPADWDVWEGGIAVYIWRVVITLSLFKTNRRREGRLAKVPLEICRLGGCQR